MPQAVHVVTGIVGEREVRLSLSCVIYIANLLVYFFLHSVFLGCHKNDEPVLALVCQVSFQLTNVFGGETPYYFEAPIV